MDGLCAYKDKSINEYAKLKRTWGLIEEEHADVNPSMTAQKQHEVMGMLAQNEIWNRLCACKDRSINEDAKRGDMRWIEQLCADVSPSTMVQNKTR